MYAVPGYTCSLLLIISKTVGPHQTVSSCWLNLHVTRYSVKPLSYLEPQSFLFSVHLSPQERPWTSVPFHLPFTRDYVSQKDSFWERWLLPPELRLLGLNDDGTLSEAFQKADPGAAVLMGLLGGKKIQLLWETGLHNLLHFLSWNVVKPLRIWCADRVQLCVSPGALYRHSCSPLLAQIIKTWLFLATGFWKPCPFNWMYVCFCCCETQK